MHNDENSSVGKENPMPNILIPFIPMIFLILLGFVAFLFINYHPLSTLLSAQQHHEITQRGEYSDEQSALEMQRAINLSPDNCIIYILLGENYVTQYNHLAKPSKDLLLQAQKQFTTMIDRCPGYIDEPLAHYDLSRVYFMMEDYSHAKDELETFVNTATQKGNPPTVANGYAGLVDVYRALNLPDKSFEALKLLINYDTDVPDQSQWLNELNLELQNKPELAHLNPGRALGFGRYQSAVVSNDGLLHLISLDKHDPTIAFYSTSKDGVVWNWERILTIDFAPSVAMAIDKHDVLHFVYVSNGNAIVYSNTQNGLEKTLDLSLSDLKPPAGLDVFGQTVYSPIQMSVDDQQNAYIAWSTNSTLLGYAMIQSDSVREFKYLAEFRYVSRYRSRWWWSLCCLQWH